MSVQFLFSKLHGGQGVCGHDDSNCPVKISSVAGICFRKVEEDGEKFLYSPHAARHRWVGSNERIHAGGEGLQRAS